MRAGFDAVVSLGCNGVASFVGCTAVGPFTNFLLLIVMGAAPVRASLAAHPQWPMKFDLRTVRPERRQLQFHPNSVARVIK